MPPIFFRVTNAEQPILTEEQCALLQHNTELIGFLRFVLVRDKIRRPTLDEVAWRFERMYARLFPDEGSAAAPAGALTLGVDGAFAVCSLVTI